MNSALRREVFNLPNYLTMARIVAIPGIVWLLVQDSPLTNLIAVSVFLLAALTDLLDGYLARRMGLDSALGKLLDPLADKILVSTVMIALVPLGRLEAWIPMVVIGREFTISGLRGMAAAEGMIIAAGQLGKEKTAYQMIGLAFLMAGGSAPLGWWPGAAVYSLDQVGYVLILISVFYAVISAIEYLYRFTRAAMSREL
jgi:CDP-diacylglycerol--glycerol-3-phosphate 3-phosphatidyltransferase